MVERRPSGLPAENLGRRERGDLAAVGLDGGVDDRTWLCGGRIVVAKDSFVAHAFREKFHYKVNGLDVRRNYLRIANVWLDEKHLALFYEAGKYEIINGSPGIDFGDISGRVRRTRFLL